MYGHHARMEHVTDTDRIRRTRDALVFLREALGDTEVRTAQAGVRVGQLARVTRGCFVAASVWDAWFPEQRLLARTIAVAELNARFDPLFSHQSAAVVWGLPLFRVPDLRVHALTPAESPGRSSATVMRHAAVWDADEETRVAGVRVTSLTRTVLDLARAAEPETAITAADAALRALFTCRAGGRDEEAEEAWRSTQLRRLDEMAGRRGVRRGRSIVELADGRADSPAESVSRLYLAQLGVPVAIQVPVVGSNGAQYRVDFEFIGQRTFGEVDGRIKYLDPALRGGRSAEEVVLQEKEREDDIRGTTGNGLVRWGSPHLSGARGLGMRLRAFGLRVPKLEGVVATGAARGRDPRRRERERFR